MRSTNLWRLGLAAALVGATSLVAHALPGC
jgi:hypothetical protein